MRGLFPAAQNPLLHLHVLRAIPAVEGRIAALVRKAVSGGPGLPTPLARLYNARVVRKQLYLREDQEARLKRKARETGLSEAELVRLALDRYLSEGAGHLQALEAFLHDAEQISRQHRLPQGWRFERGRGLPPAAGPAGPAIP